MKKKALDIEAVIDMDVPLMDSTKNLIEEGKLLQPLTIVWFKRYLKS